MLSAFFWVIPRRLNFICRRFGTLCLFHLHRQVGVKNASHIPAYEDGTDSVFRNVGIYNSEAGELPRRKPTTLHKFVHVLTSQYVLYTRVNKNPSAWNFLSPKPEVTCGTVAIIIRVVLLSPYLRIRAVSLSSIHYNQSHRVYINRRRQYICLIWN